MKARKMRQRSETDREAEEKLFELGRNAIFICPPTNEKVGGAGQVMVFGISSHFFRVRGVRDIETHEPQYGLERFGPHPQENLEIFARNGGVLDHYLINTL